MRYYKVLSLLIMLALLPISSLSAEEPVDMHRPVPLQIKSNPDEITVLAEDIVSILHPLIEGSTANFKPSDAYTINIDGNQYNVGDFVLTPGKLEAKGGVALNFEIFTENATIATVSLDNIFKPALYYRNLYIADVRDAMSDEAPLVPPIIFRNGILDPYKSPKAIVPTIAPAFSLTKIEGSEDLALVTYDKAEYAYEMWTGMSITSPIIYFKRMETGLYRIAGVLGRENGLKNDLAVDIEALNIENDPNSLPDLAVVNNAQIDGEAYVLFFMGQGQSWTNLEKAFAWPTESYPVGKFVLDSAVGSDKVGGLWRNFLLVPSFGQPDANGNFIAYKFFTTPENLQIQKEEISLGSPTYLPCSDDERCGPVRIKCTRYNPDSSSEISDLNGDGCSDCVVTWGKIVDDEDGSYYELFDSFTVFLNKPVDGLCSGGYNSYQAKEVLITAKLPNKYYNDIGTAPKAKVFAIEIANADPFNDDFLDIWIGDQQSYLNYESPDDDRDSLVYLFQTEIFENGGWYLDDYGPHVKSYDANYEVLEDCYQEDKKGCGVKAISADAFANLGVVNGDPFIPVIPGCQPLSIDDVGPDGPSALTKCLCEEDRDLDGWMDIVPAELDLDGDGISDLFEKDEISEYVVCDPCIMGSQWDKCEPDGSCQGHQTECGGASCKNNIALGGGFIKPPMNPPGCEELVGCDGYPGMGTVIDPTTGDIICPYEIPEFSEDLINLNGTDNDIDNDCIPDCRQSGCASTPCPKIACDDVNDLTPTGDPFDCAPTSPTPLPVPPPAFEQIPDKPVYSKVEELMPITPNLSIKKACGMMGEDEETNYYIPADVEVEIVGIKVDNDKDNNGYPDCEVKDGAFTGEGCTTSIDCDLPGVDPDCEDYTKEQDAATIYECEDTGPVFQSSLELDIKNRLFRFASFISDTFVKTATAAEPILPTESEATVLINKYLKADPGPGPEPTPSPTTVFGVCTVNADRSWATEEELDEEGRKDPNIAMYKGGRMYIRSLNDQFRKDTGLFVDPFVGEYMMSFTAELYPPAINVWGADIQKSFSDSSTLTPIFQYTGMRVVNYAARRTRPPYKKYLVDKPWMLLPTPKLEADLNVSVPAGVETFADSDVIVKGNSSTYVINGAMEIEYSISADGVFKGISTNEAFVSPLRVTISSAAGMMDGCAWQGLDDCDVAVPSYAARGSNGKSGLDAGLFLNNVASLSKKYREDGRPITPAIIRDALKINRWDSTGFLEQSFGLIPPEVVNTATKAAGFAPVPSNVLTPDELSLVNANVTAFNEAGKGCYMATILIAPMPVSVRGGGGCKCNMQALPPAWDSVAIILVILGFGAVLYILRRRRA